MKKLSYLFLLTLLGCFSFSCKQEEAPTITCEESIDELGINQIQILGSHNSYKQKTPEAIVQLMLQFSDLFPPGFSPEDWDYGHVSLEVQFDNFGIRSIELDVFNDPEGGLFYHRRANTFLGAPTESGIEALTKPGLKVQHFPDLDYETNYYTFVEALTSLKNWSDSHPNHLPIYVMVEPKEDNPSALMPGLTETIPFDPASLTSIDDEIKSVFGDDLKGVLTPDEVRADHSTLNEVVRDKHWTTLGSARGKVVFIMLGSGNEKADYLAGHPSLAGRAMFLFSEEGNPETAFIKVDDPIENESKIQDLVAQGYIVRTRADANTLEARSGDYTRWQAALRSGAQIISTDYYQADERAGIEEGWTNYSVAFNNNAIALFSPINMLEEIECAVGE